MSDFTYEKNNTASKLETLEWDNVWWEQTAKHDGRRILYVGDSISCGTRRLITRVSDSSVLCDGFGTSKATDNPHFKPSLELYMAQQNECDTVLFNNGLHGWHLSEEEYGRYYEEILLFLQKMKRSVYVVLTTDVLNDPERNERVDARNEIAKALAQKYQLPVIDLHTVAVNHPEHHTADGIHFDAVGYELLAKCILESIGG